MSTKNQLVVGVGLLAAAVMFVVINSSVQAVEGKISLLGSITSSLMAGIIAALVTDFVACACRSWKKS